MPIHYQDVENLNRGLEYMGNSFARQREQQDEASYRQRVLDEAVARQNAAEQHYKAEEQHYSNMEKAQSDAAAKAQDAAQLREKQGFVGELMKLNATGQLKDLDAVNHWLATDPHFSKVGLQLKTPPTKPAPQVGQSAVAMALKQADQWRQQADASAQTDPDTAARYSDYADKLEAWANLQANPKEKDVIETQEFDAKPGEDAKPGAPATSGFLGVGRKPEIPPTPAVPPTPKRTVRIPHPAGWRPDQGAPAAPAAPTGKATPAQKAARANAIAQQNPTWTRQQVLDQVNREMP